MRFWIAVFMLALLPLQFSWAAVAAYCGHESAQQTQQHPGHHEHQHPGQADADKDPAPTTGQNAPAGFDFDCGHCHGSCASMAAAVEDLALLCLAPQPVAASAGRMRTYAQSPPERPQWRPLA